MKELARKYDKRVGIGTVPEVADGFGGLVQGTLTIQQTRWCYVETPKAVNASQYKNTFGLKGDARILKFYFRHFDFDIKTQALQYDNGNWAPLAVEDTDQYKVQTCIVAQAIADNL